MSCVHVDFVRGKRADGENEMCTLWHAVSVRGRGEGLVDGWRLRVENKKKAHISRVTSKFHQESLYAYVSNKCLTYAFYMRL